MWPWTVLIKQSCTSYSIAFPLQHKVQRFLLVYYEVLLESFNMYSEDSVFSDLQLTMKVIVRCKHIVHFLVVNLDEATRNSCLLHVLLKNTAEHSWNDSSFIRAGDSGHNTLS